jgi:hypothetical protein
MLLQTDREDLSQTGISLTLLVSTPHKLYQQRLLAPEKQENQFYLNHCIRSVSFMYRKAK